MSDHVAQLDGAPGTVHIVVMGVSGVGKTTLARRIAAETGWDHLEADVLHPDETLRGLLEGNLPDDEVRRRWLEQVRAWIAERASAGRNSVVACTALRREHRRILSGFGAAQVSGGSGVSRSDAGSCPETVFFVHLHGTRDVLEQRLAGRLEEFERRGPGESAGVHADGPVASPELLRTQLDDLQRLSPEELGLQLDVRRTPEQLLDDALNAARFAVKAYS